MREVLFIREGRAASEGGNLVAPLGEEHPDWGGGAAVDSTAAQSPEAVWWLRATVKCCVAGQNGAAGGEKVRGSQRGHQSSSTLLAV